MDEAGGFGFEGETREATAGRSPTIGRGTAHDPLAGLALPSTEAVLPWLDRSTALPQAPVPPAKPELSAGPTAASTAEHAPPPAQPGLPSISARPFIAPAVRREQPPVARPGAEVPTHALAAPPATPLAEAAQQSATEPAPVQSAARWWAWSGRGWHWGRRVLIAGLAAFLVWTLSVAVQIVLYRTLDPPTSNLMLWHRLGGDVVVQQWLPVERMPAQLVRAIVVSEDGRFCSHRGIDFKELELAIERSKDGTPRGASTITMQVAKNLFLWPSKSYLRKALEVPITLAIEALWTKRRIFEVYANIAEWGPGVFGVEAAAGYHFGKSASRISEREAALLAVALPNPVARDAGDPGPGTERLATSIQARMRGMSRAASCVERMPRPQGAAL